MHIVLVHGAGGTPATWQEVIPLLLAAGAQVSAVTNPMQSLQGDVRHTTQTVDAVRGPVLLVGHSYGGAVITSVGLHERVAGLVYVAAFGPAEGETVSEIVERYEPAEVSAYMRRGPDGEWSSEHGEDYWRDIGWDVTAAQRIRWDQESRPAANAIFSEPTVAAAWRIRPSWYVVAADDKTLRPQAQRDMAQRMRAVVTVLPGSHFAPRVHPAEITAVILGAAASLQPDGSP